MHSNRKLSQYLKLGIIIVMVIIFSCYPTFASDSKCSWVTKDSLDTIYVFLTNLWKFFSWIWIVLWNFAGVLMTNAMVYWEFMHLDSFLWKIWQMSRTIANYALWFLFIYYIFKYIFFKDDKPPIGKVKDILVASVLVQISRFMVMVLVDLSTIGLATVSSFSSQVLSADSKMLETFKSEMVKSDVLNDKKIIVINAFTDDYLEWDNSTWFSIEKTEWGGWSVDPKKETMDALLPSASNLWGPFIYLWATAFKAQDFVTRPIPVSANCVDTIEKVITNLILQSWTVILYSIALALLIVLLVMRLAFLRIFIAISPIVVLIYALDLSSIKKWNLLNNDIKDILDLKKVIVLIFKPVIFAFWISMMFIVVVTVQRLFDQSASSYLDNVGLSDKSKTWTRTDAIPKISSTLENAWIVSVYLKNWATSLKDVVLALITLVLMWQLIKLALTWSIWSIWGFNENSQLSQRMNKMLKNTWKVFWGIWVIPTPKGRMWFNQVWDSDYGYSPLITEAKGKLEKEFTKRDKSQETILALLWEWDKVVVKSVTETQKGDIIRAVRPDNAPSVFVDKLDALKKSNDWALKFEDVWKEIQDWVTKRKDLETTNRDYYKTMYNYFGKANWDALCTEINKDEKNFSIKNWFDKNSSGFKEFYTNVLKGNEKYDNYKDFIDKWGIITTKSENK